MKDFLLCLVLLAAAVLGYFGVGKIDELIKEIRRAGHNSEIPLKKRKNQYII